MLNRTGSLLICALIAVVAGCGGKTDKKKETASEKTPQLKVDCEQMCTKTFRQCVGEVLVASGKMDQAKIDMIKKAGVLKKVQDAGYGACIKDCKKKQGFGSDADEINKCLALKGCNEYARCIKIHIQ